MNDFQDADSHASQRQFEKPRGRSCSSCLFGLIMSWCFLFWGICFTAPLVLLKAPTDYTVTAGCIFLFSFLWQRSAARRGCFMPFIILVLFLLSEFAVLGVLIYETEAYKKVDLKKVQRTLDEHAPGLYEAGVEALTTVKAWSGQTWEAGREAVSSVIASLTENDDDRRLVELEEAFRNNPGNAAVVLALADAYMGKNDLASTQLAIALYQALVETDPCDAFLARLADAYARISRYDAAFTIAVRRTWLPHAMIGRAARQIAFLAASSGELARGIFELERILQRNPVESEEIRLLLAGLYQDSGNQEQANVLLDQVIEGTPPGLGIAETALTMKKATGN